MWESRSGRFRCGSPGMRLGVHIELFAGRRALVVPAGIGVASPATAQFGVVTPHGCTYAARTRTPTGVIEVRQEARLTLGDLFRIWGQPLGPSRLAGFHSSRPVLAFVGGRRWHEDPRAIPLRRHAQIVLEVGGYVPPHRDFLFPAVL